MRDQHGKVFPWEITLETDLAHGKKGKREGRRTNLDGGREYRVERILHHFCLADYTPATSICQSHGNSGVCLGRDVHIRQMKAFQVQIHLRDAWGRHGDWGKRQGSHLVRRGCRRLTDRRNRGGKFSPQRETGEREAGG